MKRSIVKKLCVVLILAVLLGTLSSGCQKNTTSDVAVQSNTTSSTSESEITKNYIKSLSDDPHLYDERIVKSSLEVHPQVPERNITTLFKLYDLSNDVAMKGILKWEMYDYQGNMFDSGSTEGIVKAGHIESFNSFLTDINGDDNLDFLLEITYSKTGKDKPQSMVIPYLQTSDGKFVYSKEAANLFQEKGIKTISEWITYSTRHGRYLM